MTFGTKFNCGRVIKTLCLFANILTFTKGSFSVRAMESSNSYLIKLLEVLSYSIFFFLFLKICYEHVWLYGQWVISPWVNCKLTYVFSANHLVRLTIWYQLFLEFWLVDTWLFAHPRDQRAVTRLEYVRLLNISRGKKLSVQWSHRQPIVVETLESFMPCELDNALQKQLPRSVLIKKCS